MQPTTKTGFLRLHSSGKLGLVTAGLSTSERIYNSVYNAEDLPTRPVSRVDVAGDRTRVFMMSNRVGDVFYIVRTGDHEEGANEQAHFTIYKAVA